MMNIICRPDLWTGISGDYGENVGLGVLLEYMCDGGFT